MILDAGLDIELPAERQAARLVRRSLGSGDRAARRACVEIEIPHGRYLYVLPLGRRPVEYAGYTFVARAPGERRGARRRRPPSPLALALRARGSSLLRTRQLAGVLGVAAFPLDDSWIHLHFARNLAEGAGFAYNPGVPVAGSTAPLWTLAARRGRSRRRRAHPRAGQGRWASPRALGAARG